MVSHSVAVVYKSVKFTTGIYIFNERWRRKEEASKVKQTTRQSNTAHPRQSFFPTRTMYNVFDSTALLVPKCLVLHDL